MSDTLMRTWKGKIHSSFKNQCKIYPSTIIILIRYCYRQGIPAIQPLKVSA